MLKYCTRMRYIECGDSITLKLIQLHVHQASPLFPIFGVLSRRIHRHSSVAQDTFTPSIRTNLRLPRTRPGLTSAINTLLAIRILIHSFHMSNSSQYSLISPTRYSLSISALLSTSSFLTQSIRDTPTKLHKHFISRTFSFLLSALLIPHASAP